MDAIYKRSAVRSYTSKMVDKASITLLLNATVRAPSAMDEEPWEFVIIQDKAMLSRLSDTAKNLLTNDFDRFHPATKNQDHNRFIQPDFNAFYNAGTLIVIYGKPLGSFVAADCWLAAETLMLAACALGLGTYVIGLAVTTLNTLEWKKELGVSLEWVAYAPIIIGISAGDTTLKVYKSPEIIWK